MIKTKNGGRWAIRFAGAMSALALLAMERDAHALPLLTLWGSVRGLYGSVAGDEATVGWGSSTGTQNETVNGYGPGLGLSAGVTLPLSLYVGASFDYFFGETVSFNAGPDVSRASSQLLARVGYDLGLGPLTLRPELGLGALFSKVKVEGGEPETSDRDLTANGTVLAPALEAFFGLGLLNVNAEARYELVAGDNSNAVVLGLGLGVSL
jgi:hypothetical protein